MQGLIAARLDLLEPEQKSLLHDAAVIGKRFWIGALASLSARDRGALETALHALERKEFARRERSSSVVEAVNFGQKGFARWFEAVVMPAEYELGHWAEAVARADAFLAEVEAGSPHYLAHECYFSRGMIRMSRGDDSGAVADVERALELAHRARDPQALYPSSAGAAFVFMELGDRARALGPAGEFLDAVAAGRGVGFAQAHLHILSWALTAAGRGEEVVAAYEQEQDFPWARAGIAFGRGDPVEAAEILAGIGAVASEAYCRLTAARMLLDEGRRAEADEQLQRALAFYRSVRASRYVREGESLLAVSA